MLKLLVKPPGGEPYTVALDKLPVMIGRSTRSAVRLEDPFSSRLHAELAEGEGGWRLSDLGSGNGTYLNGRRVGSQALARIGDRIQIGNTVIEVTAEEPSAAPEPEADFIARPQATRREASTSRMGLPARGRPSARGERTGAFRGLVHGNALFELLSKGVTALLSPADLGEVFNQILDLIFEEIAAERAFLMLREGESGELVCKVASFRRGGTRGRESEARISASILAEVVGHGRAVLTSDAQVDPRFRDQKSIRMAQIRSVMAVPIAVDGRILGMLYVDSPAAANVFGDEDLQMLAGVAGVAAVKIENAVLLEERIESERLRQQLLSAREIQRRLLPQEPPVIAGYEISGTTSPSGEVGGDHFDYVPLAGGHWLIAQGDVSGKGLDAALLSSSLHASLRAQVGSGARGADLVARLNAFLHENSPANRYVTLFVAELDPATHRLTYVNAGHNHPLLVRGGDGAGTEELGVGGPPVGVLPAATYQEGSILLAPGDVLLIYSDGISEATNASGEELGAEALGQVVRRFPGALASELQVLIEQELTTFAGSGPQSDDRTLIVVRRVR